ncbi:YigZ family protein [Bacilliculturomica massiliensis]|uniref:YigZ family protein n=1 Tax=Bacilliculturomica massiliensis TaxID=1917867 RepID=UPI0013EF4DFF|nr:YigZ family protein [Bacilliculturomica massiliensis]
MIRYKTVKQKGEAEQVIERSRFLSYAAPVNSREEAEAFIAGIRDLHRQATHNVPAFIVGEKSELKWCSDDGEPQGTAGAPVLQMLDREGLTNVAVVVTRYFGGVKLGTGGLVRAYTGSAKLAVEAAGIHQVRETVFLTAEIGYTFLGKLQNLEKDGAFVIADTEFSDVVRITLTCAPEDLQAVEGLLSEVTGGGCRVLDREEKLV